MPNSLNLVPLWLAELLKVPSKRSGFLGLYARAGSVKVIGDAGAGEQDLVLNRRLEGFTRLAPTKAKPISAADDVVQALQKIQAQLDALQAPALTAALLFPLLESADGIYLTLTDHNTVLISRTPSDSSLGNQYVEPGYVEKGYVV